MTCLLPRFHKDATSGHLTFSEGKLWLRGSCRGQSEHMIMAEFTNDSKDMHCKNYELFPHNTPNHEWSNTRKSRQPPGWKNENMALDFRQCFIVKATHNRLLYCIGIVHEVLGLHKEQAQSIGVTGLFQLVIMMVQKVFSLLTNYQEIQAIYTIWLLWRHLNSIMKGQSKQKSMTCYN